ncbi:hypothetical protein N869_06910 [Cellulomonas bogoriensis 69B4 = DSM 16987]|uniref:DUF2000 domain-containing protein n=1 Tax=Cellulomonas bogoriensis 69B4 = DSM 16987 TaxID=1386082 RepID=A0A0A0C1A9_9CELL|nr:hypothetical protein N869_06910 [Cellulomonas bogoriensis 69B4 = DSM 16987]
MDVSASKCAVVVDESLPTGLAANAASVLAMTLTHRVPELIGADVEDASGTVHAGIVLIPVPILTAPRAEVRELFERATEDPETTTIAFSSLAQSCKTYDEYVERMSHTATAELGLVGIGVVGPRRSVNRLCGSLPLLR